MLAADWRHDNTAKNTSDARRSCRSKPAALVNESEVVDIWQLASDHQVRLAERTDTTRWIGPTRQRRKDASQQRGLNSVAQLILTRLVLNQLGVSSSHYLTNFTKLLNLKLQFRTDEASHLFVGLSTLTTLTSLDVVFRIGDDKWQEITRLTNLQSLSELGYVGNRELRFLDLTAMQKLTSFVTQSPPVAAEAILMNFTALTSLQHINFAVDYKTQNILLERLPYLERPPQKPTYRV